MKDKRSLHLKVQEHCDCYATTDPLKEMSDIPKEQDKEEGGLKWLALAALHGVNNGAKKITLSKSKDGSVKVKAKYREAELPSPGSEVGQKIIEEIREITHLEGKKGKTPLALGIRDSSIELTVKVEEDEIILKFPG
jgi:hypothetical protein